MHQFFGSADSTDTDVIFFVDQLPATILERAEHCRLLSATLAEALGTDKAVNGNLAVLKDGHLAAVYKGTTDELNNSLFSTYDLHPQTFPNQVLHTLPRDVNLKCIRCTRMILSALTRTVYRSVVKAALQKSIQHRLEALRLLDLRQITDTRKGYSLADMKKVLAFQLGQTLALHAGRELYTKQAICETFATLRPYLYRQAEADAGDLQALLQDYVEVLAARIPGMNRTDEYDYEITLPA